MGIKIFYIGDNEAECTKWIEDLTLVKIMEEADIVLFGDGPLVNPHIWGGTMVTLHGLKFAVDDSRDITDIKLFMKARKMKKKIMGVGRGAILCGALSGSNVVQYHENPRSFHYSDDIYGGIKMAPWSMASRMLLYPAKLNHTEVAIYGTTLRPNRMHLMDNATDIKQLVTGETQTCMFFETNCLCICPFVWDAVGEDFEPFVRHCNHLISDFKEGRIGPMANPFEDRDEDEDDEDVEDDESDFDIAEKPEEKKPGGEVYYGGGDPVQHRFVPSDFFVATRAISGLVGNESSIDVEIKERGEERVKEAKENYKKAVDRAMDQLKNSSKPQLEDYWRAFKEVKK